MPVDPIERLAANARRRSEQTLQKAQDAITVMAARGDAITVARLAKNAQVSRSWIYTQPELRERIEQLRQAAPARPPRSAAASRASLDSLKHRLTSPTSASPNYATRTSSFGERSNYLHGQLRDRRQA